MDQYAAVFGRLHLLILHLPIGLVIGIVALELIALFRRQGAGAAAPQALLWLNAAVALIAALSGLKLSQEAGYGGWTLTIHLWLGIAVAITATGVAILRSMLTDDAPGRSLSYRAALAGLLVLIVLAGHFGGTMTHGEWFVLAPLRGGEGSLTAEEVDFSQFGPASEAGFAHVAPLLAQRCTTCHSGSKAQSELSLDSFAGVQKGGLFGPVLAPDDPSASELLRRITLPDGDPERMPPEGRRQLSSQEIALLRAWVTGAGASPEETTADSTAAIETLRATFSYANPLAADSSLLWIDMSFAEPPLEEPQIIELLRPLANQVGDLTASRCAVTDEFAKLAAQMPNLRRLNLHETAVSDAAIATLAAHPTLKELVLTRTGVTDDAVDGLLAMPALERVYLWGSKVTPEGAQKLAAARPELLADLGQFAEAQELIAEADPKFVDAGPKPGAAAAGTAASLAPVNSVCPVSGTAVNTKFLVVHEGKVIGFCCNNCPQQFWADPAKFADKIK